MKTSRIIVSSLIGIVWAVCTFFMLEECKLEFDNFQEQELLFDKTWNRYYVMNGDERFVVENFSSPRVGNASAKTRMAFEGKKVYTFYWKGDFKVYPCEEGEHKYFLSNLRTHEVSWVAIVGMFASAVILFVFIAVVKQENDDERYKRKVQEVNDRKYQESPNNKK